jgi:Protein of unknown function (DUF4019)
MSRIVFRLALSGALLLYFAAVLPKQARAQDKPEAQAQKAAEQWLGLVDAGKYGESWDASAQAFKSAVSRQNWIKQVSAARRPLGRLISRKLTKSNLVKDPPNSPPGDYVGIQYRSSFQNLKSAIETVVPMRDPDGKWRVSGYFVRSAG